MPSVKYVGVFDEVQVDLPNDLGGYRTVVVKKGDSIEVSGELAKNLVQQKGNWESTSSKKGGDG